MNKLTYEEKIEKAYESLCESNMVTRIDCPIEDHPNYFLIFEVADDPAQSWNL